MKRNILAILIPTLLVATTSHAAEIYNKDGNKLDLYGKVKALHYFSDNTKVMVINRMFALVSKVSLK